MIRTIRPRLTATLAGLPEGLRSLMVDSARAWAAQTVAMALALFSTVLITRALGAEGRGIYAWLLALAMVGSQVALLGMDTTNRRMAGGTNLAAALAHTPTLLRLTLLLCGAGGVLIALMLAIYSQTNPFGQAHPFWLLLAMATVPMLAIGNALGMLLTAQQKITSLIKVTLVPRTLVLVLTLATFAFGVLDERAALSINLAAQLSVTLLSLWYLRPSWPMLPSSPPWQRLLTGGLWRYTSAAYVAGLMQLLMQRVDILMLGQMLGSAPTGYYSVAVTLTDVIITPVHIIAMFLSTRLGPVAQGGFTRRSMLAVYAGSFAFVCLCCLAAMAVAPQLVPLLFGKTFYPAVSALRWLAPAAAMLALYFLLQTGVAALAPGRYVPIAPTIGCLSNIALNFWLIPAMGVPGACLASLLSYAFAAAAAGIILHRQPL